MDSALQFFQNRKHDVSVFIKDFRQLVLGSDRVLTDEQILTIHDFASSIQTHIDSGRNILKTIPPLNDDAFQEAEYTLNQMDLQLKNLIQTINQTEQGVEATSFGAASGAISGCLIGAKLCPFDAGLLAAIGTVIGGLVGAASTAGQRVYESKEIKILAPNLICLVENVKNLEDLMRVAYGQ